MVDERSEPFQISNEAHAAITGHEPTSRYRHDLSVLSDEALATMLRETKANLHRAKDASFQAREALTKAEHDRYIAEMSNANPSRFQQVTARLYATQAVATLRDQEETSLLHERSAVEAERKWRMQMREAAIIAERDRQRVARRRSEILANAHPAQQRSLLDRMKEAVAGAGAARSPADR